jgi:hypothetical protein
MAGSTLVPRKAGPIQLRDRLPPSLTYQSRGGTLPMLIMPYLALYHIKTRCLAAVASWPECTISIGSVT